MVLVTGITGLTGRFLYDILCREKIKFRCLVRKSSKYKELKPYTSVEFVTGDVTSVEDIAVALDGIDTVIHLVNIRSSPQIIEACKIRNIKRVIFINTTSIYSKYQRYAKQYEELEKHILASDLDYTIIRPTMIYGNEQDKNIRKLVKLVATLPVFPIVGKGSHLMQPIYAKDVAEVIFSAYKNDISIKNSYNVAGKETMSYLQLIKEIGKALDRDLKLFFVPYKLALAIGRIGDYIPNGLITYEKIQRLGEDKCFDYSEASKDLGFSPMSFSEGIKKEVAALKKAGLI